MPRLTEAELDRLEQFLNEPERPDDALPLDMAQGLLAAVASGPQPVPQDVWLAAIVGEDREFASEAEESDITTLLERFAADTAQQLNEGEGFDFILYGDEDGEDLGDWAEGYLLGVDLADPRWDELADEEDYDNILFPFLALTGDAKQMALEASEEWMDEAEEAKMLDEIRTNIASHLLDVRQFWFDKSVPPTVRREGPKIGRNDPCPCGSGKKYKNCHGAE
ncbi:MAG TPA: UPF0149 family protein [Usitatibacter sp.]|jgi:uncharacterized protein|nr:UPF0149 family protein [Usitatibacter sp.]